jgi:hypothetical protein
MKNAIVDLCALYANHDKLKKEELLLLTYLLIPLSHGNMRDPGQMKSTNVKLFQHIHIYAVYSTLVSISDGHNIF